MTILDRYFFKRCGIALFKTLLALLLVYILIDFLAGRQVDVRKHDVPFSAVVQYYLALTPQVIARVAPLAMLVSLLLVLGEAAQNNEVTAALAAGISLRRLTRIPILVALGLSIGLFCAQETVGVSAAQTVKQLDESYFARQNEGPRKGVSWTRLGEKGWTCHIAKFNRAALTGEKVLMHSIRPDALELIQARRIFWDEKQGAWLLEDGSWRSFAPDSSVETASRRITQLAAPFSESPEVLFAASENPSTKQPWTLAEDIARAENRGEPTAALWVDYYTKFSQPAVSFVMAWLAIPFAMRLRRGGLAISFGVSIAIAIAFLLVFTISVAMGKVDRLEPVVAAWAANVLFLAIGVDLYYRTPT